MANISAQLVKELRERTGAGFMDCKKALVAANGDIELAIDNMRKNGAVKAAKKSGRITAEGVIAGKADAGRAVIVEVNCETDFVATSDDFKNFVNQVVDVAFAADTDDVEKVKSAKLADGTTVQDALTALIAKLGENMNVRRVAVMHGDNLGFYIHSNKRIGVLCSLEGGNADIAKDISMHIAALHPQFLRPSDVSAEGLEKERQIQTELELKETAELPEGKRKPEAIIHKIIDGRMSKFSGEVSLYGQVFVKDSKQKVSAFLQANKAEVTSFIRFEVGEGIEKNTVDFAEEVKAQMAAAQK